MRALPSFLATLSAVLLLGSLSAAQEKSEPAKVEEHQVERRLALDAGGEHFEYRAVASTLVLRNEEGQPRASFFSTSYTRLDADGASDPQRPLTVAFNGGPGSSSVWLHLGALGPKRVDMGPEGLDLAVPAALVDNPHSLLAKSDLVFVDPVSTGFSRSHPGEDEDKYHGLNSDVEAMGEFIRLYLTRNERWQSPLFLAGESYGTTRAALLADYLQQRHGIYPRGLILISCVLDFQTLEFDAKNDLPYALFLPSYAATAWVHKALAPELQQDFELLLRRARDFALGDYTQALMLGASLDPAARQRIAAEFARLTGLSEAFVEHSDLRVSQGAFSAELLRARGLVVGRLDARFSAPARDPLARVSDADPSYAAIQGPYGTALNHWVREELGFETDLAYEILTGRVQPWDWDGAENRYVSVSNSLRDALIDNPQLQVFVASGYLDLATPWLATRWTFDHLGGGQEGAALRARVHFEDYPAGHMLYLHEPSLVRLGQELSSFIADQGAPRKR